MEELNNMTFEESLSRLEEITSMMESRELSLDEQFRLYKEGCEMVKNCNDRLDTAEKQMVIINKNDVQ